MFHLFRMSLRLVILLLATTVVARAEIPFDSAVSLYQAGQYPAARSAFEKICAEDPNNAAAHFYVGLILEHRGDATALDDAIGWLEQAVQLAPNNPTYLAEYGGVSLELAGRHSSLAAATRGREAMEKAVQLDPGNLDARQGLFEFYEQAPWPLGSSAKAAAELDEIHKRDAARATALSVRLKTDVKDYPAALKLCAELLAKNPDDYTALYQYGRTASISGLNLARGLACLQRCLELPPPSPASPKPTNTWHRIGLIQEQLGRRAEARAAYETALKLDPGNRQAADALAKLR